jgi:SAM-dependent methyltransferase
MSSEWGENAKAWIDHVGTRGDFSREYVLDPVMLGRVRHAKYKSALDVGCGEGRFCRLLAKQGIPAIGVGPTEAFIAEARHRDPGGDYRVARAEGLGFDDGSFDLVVSYLTLIDIEDFRAAIGEMTRVLAPGGTLLIANITSFFSAGPPNGWTREGAGTEELRSDPMGSEEIFPIDRYLEERAQEVLIGNFHVRNWHRPLGAYMECFLGFGLRLIYFAEPPPISGDLAGDDLSGGKLSERDLELQKSFRRVPPFVVMEWRK